MSAKVGPSNKTRYWATIESCCDECGNCIKRRSMIKIWKETGKFKLFNKTKGFFEQKTEEDFIKYMNQIPCENQPVKIEKN